MKLAQEKGLGLAVMFDAHCAIPPATLIQFAAAIEPYNMLFFEEPAVPGNIEVFKRLKQQIRVPAGHWRTRPHHLGRDRPICRTAASTSCSRTLAHTGGISQMRKIAALARPITCHWPRIYTCSELGLSASLHASAAATLFLIQEGYLDGHIMPPGVRSQALADRRGRLRLAAARARG